MHGADIRAARRSDLSALLPMMRAYCDFYAADPHDDDLLALSRALLADPDCEGLQLVAMGADGRALGFATIVWGWSTLLAGRIGTMNDLFVVPDARGRGLAEALIEECRRRCRERGARQLGWQTAMDNHRAQAVYDRVGGVRAQWLDYSLDP